MIKIYRHLQGQQIIIYELLRYIIALEELHKVHIKVEVIDRFKDAFIGLAPGCIAEKPIAVGLEIVLIATHKIFDVQAMATFFA